MILTSAFVGVVCIAPDEERLVFLKPVVQFYFIYGASSGFKRFSIYLFILHSLAINTIEKISLYVCGDCVWQILCAVVQHKCNLKNNEKKIMFTMYPMFMYPIYLWYKLVSNIFWWHSLKTLFCFLFFIDNF